MLGRHGNNLFWMARYLERCENTARIIQATLNYSLSREDEGKDEWLSIIYNSGYEKVFFEKYNGHSINNFINFLIREKGNANSIISLISKARQNGRTVRTSLTKEVWFSLNESWINCESSLKRQLNIRDLPTILEDIVKGSSLFRGALYGTMLHNDIFNFLRLGTFLERADNTARVIHTKYYRLLPTATDFGGNNDQSQWEIMLRSVAAWRSYNWLKKGRLDPINVADFIIFDARMPRSIYFCYKECKSNLKDLSVTYGKEYSCEEKVRKCFIELEKSKKTQNYKINFRNFINNQISNNLLINKMISNDFNFS